MKYYPNTLPLALQAGYAIDKTPSVIRTEMTDGSIMQRRMRKYAPLSASITLSIKGEQKTAFDDFIADIEDGADWFVMPLLIGNAIEPRKVRIQKGKRKESLTFRNSGGAVWSVSLTLDVDEVTKQADEWDEYYQDAPWSEQNG